MKVYIKVAKVGIETANKAIDLYDDMTYRMLPWKEFDETVAELDKYRRDFSIESANQLGNVEYLLMEGLDAYFRSTQSVYEWAGLTVNLLETYVKLFDNYDASKTKAQKTILIKVFKNGVEKMARAQEQLEMSASRLHEAAGNLTALNTRLSDEFDSKSKFFNKTLSLIRVGGEAFGVLADIPIIGQFAKIPQNAIERRIISRLESTFQSIKTFYENTKVHIRKAFEDIQETKDKLNDEIRIIGDIKMQTEETSTDVELDKELQHEAIDAANKLIEQCRSYRQRIQQQKQSNTLKRLH